MPKKTEIDHYTDKEALDFHVQGKSGKIEISSSKPLTTKRDLSLAYSPGVAAPVKEIAKNPDLAYDKIARSRAPIGRLIMDQSVMAGIGNIYRSEILWRQAVHPETPGKAINRQTFDQIWDDARTLLAIGVERNAIITVFDGQLPKKRYGEKFNIFGKASCPKCEGEIRRFEISGRRTFVCDYCQPLMR